MDRDTWHHPLAPTRRHLCPPTTGRAGGIAPPPSAFWAFALLLPQLYCMRLPCWAFVFYRCEFRRMISSRLSLSLPLLPLISDDRRTAAPCSTRTRESEQFANGPPLGWFNTRTDTVPTARVSPFQAIPPLRCSIRRAAGVFAGSSGAPGCSAATPETPVAQLSHSSEAIPN